MRFLFFLLVGNIKSLNIIAAMPFFFCLKVFFVCFLHFCLLYRKIKNKNAHDDSVCSRFSQYNIFTSLVISLYSHFLRVFVCISLLFECCCDLDFIFLKQLFPLTFLSFFLDVVEQLNRLALIVFIISIFCLFLKSRIF